MKVNMKLVGMVVSLFCMPLLMALPQSMLVSDVVLRQDASGSRQASSEQRVPLLGKITAMHENSLEVANPNGEPVTVKITPKTEFHKDRQPAKRSDFKVGDIILVRGEENADHSWTAQIIAARSMNGPNGQYRGNGPGMVERTGKLGQDYVLGEVKSVDPPKIAVLRTDNVAQTLELNEETSLRKGRDSITMADVQVGDHLFARGGVESGVFVPKFVAIVDPEHWKAMQEMGVLRARPFEPPAKGAQPAKPAEPQH